MKKQTREAVPMRTFKFSCRVVDGHELIDAIVAQGVDYYNARVQERRVELESQQQCLCEMVPGWGDLQVEEEAISEELAAVDEYFNKLKSKYSKVKLKPADYTQTREQLAELKAKRKVIWDRRKELKPVYQELYIDPNKAYHEILKERSRDTSGRVHPLKISRNRPVVLTELEPTSRPSWVEHHRRVQKQAETSRAFRRAGHHDSMDLVLSDVQRAIKDAGMTAPRTRGRGQGQVGVAISPPLTWDTVNVGTVKSNFWMAKQEKTGKRLRQNAAIVPAAIKIGEGQLINLTVLQHRDIPAGAKLCKVVLQARMFKGRIQHFLSLVMEHSSFAVASRGKGTVAVNFGWRKIGDTYRAAYMVDSYGEVSTVELPEEIPSNIEYAEHLISVRDRIFNDFRPEALALGNTYKVFPPDLIASVEEYMRRKGKMGSVAMSLANISGGKFNWFLDKVIASHLSSEWRQSLWDEWLDNHQRAMVAWNEHKRGPKPDLWEPHFETFRAQYYQSSMAPELILAFWMDTWRRKHMHLSSWAGDQKAKAIRRRMDFYRNVAAEMAAKYDKVVVDDTDFSKLARRLTLKQREALPVEEVAIREAGNSHRFLVAPSELRQCLVYRFGKDNILKVKAENLSKHHWKDGADIESVFGEPSGKCSECGEPVVLDHNHCVNALRRAGAVYLGDMQLPVAGCDNNAMPMAGE